MATIGSGRDYTTPQSWEDALPATLTSPETGDVYNDSEYSGTGTRLDISGHTTTSTNKIIFQAATGQSFSDNASVRTNALRYNASNGVAIRKTDNYGSVITIGSGQHVDVTGIQVKADGSASPINAAGGAGQVVLRNVLTDANGNYGFQIASGGGLLSEAYNCVAFQRGSGGNGFLLATGSAAYACAAVRTSDVSAAGTGIVCSYGTNLVISCAAFNFSTPVSATAVDTTNSKNNACDNASGLPGSNNQHSVTFNQTTPFTDADKDSLDLRAIASTSLAANGFYSASYATDISGYTRANPPTIGAWEITAAGGGATRGTPFGNRGTAFNGGRTFHGIIQ